MFFLLSKVLLFLLRPLVWIMLLLLASIWYRRRSQRSRRLFYCALLFLWGFGNTVLFDTVARAYEYDAVALKKTYPGAIVLGGYYGIPADLQGPIIGEWHESADRLLEPYRLYQKGVIDTLLLTGGSGAIIGPRSAEADRASRFLADVQLDLNDLVLDSTARNTRENALNTQSLIGDRANDWLVVTSAWHMPRAMACFRALDLHPTPYPVDFLRMASPYSPADFLLPNAHTLDKWELLIKEWVGRLVYWLRGWA